MENAVDEDKPPSTYHTIYISNILEGYHKSYENLPQKERNYWTKYDTFDSNRAVLYGDDEKVVITSSPINPTHLSDMTSLMQWKNVVNLSPARASYSISDDCRKDSSLHGRLRAIILANPGIALIPYRLTPQFQKLIHALQKEGLTFTLPETIPQDKQFILNYFNTKRGFRHLWHMADANDPPHVQIPEGFIAEDKPEATEAAWWFKVHKKSFVIKYNKGTQGIGIHMLRHDKLPHDKKKFRDHIKKLLSDKIWNESVVIVEEAAPINEKNESVSPSIELYVDEAGKVTPSYACDQILAPDKKTFRGIYIYPELMNDPVIKRAFASGLKFGARLASYGYRGVFDVDLIRSTNNAIFAVESNLRRTGGTHLHELCLALLGPSYGSKYHALIEDVMLKNGHGLTYESCRTLFHSELFSRKTGKGILFSNPDMLNVNILMIVLIGKSRSDLDQLRASIGDKLSSSMA